MKSYSSLLINEGFIPDENGIWLKVGEVKGIQGWKLHVSSIQPDVERLLKIVSPVLKEVNVAFKIAKDKYVLAQLNEGELGESQVGKFMTIYFNCDEEALSVAEKLREITKGMRGPVIPSDLKLGDVVYARYGGFNPIIHRDVLGQTFAYIYDGNEKLMIDAREIPFREPAGIKNPFLNLMQVPTANGYRSNEKTFGPGYLIVDVIKSNAKGNIFQAIDVRKQENVSICVIKQGRKFCMSDADGRDICDRLKQQYLLHRRLEEKLNIPRVLEFFEVNGDGYLSIEYIQGSSIEEVTYTTLKNRKWSTISKKQQLKLLGILDSLIKEVEKLHNEGYVHRDITASNVWVDKNNRVYLLDLELCYKADDSLPLYFNGTPGFMSPNQLAKRKPEMEDDLYAIGCIFLLVFTGIDPRRLVGNDSRLSEEKLCCLLPGIPGNIISIIIHCIKQDPRQRPSLLTIQKYLEEYIISIQLPTESKKKWPRSIAHETIVGNRETIKGVLIKAADTLFTELPMTENGLWVSPRMNSSGQSAGLQSMELRKSVHRGVSGVLYLLATLNKFLPIVDSQKDRLEQVAYWLIENNDCVDAGMPGLYFGDMGICVALVESMESGLIKESPEIVSFISNTVNRESSWHDITHGVAGMGIGCMRVMEYLKERNLSCKIHEYADVLLKSQNSDGSWTVPEGVEGMSGQVLTGFAHGVAGIVYFLAQYGSFFKNDKALNAAFKGAEWLMGTGFLNEKRKLIEWEYGTGQTERWKWWCHGGPGIALTFLKLYEITREKRYRDVAEKSLNAHPDHIMYPNLSLCHGMAGLGEIYLEAVRVFQNKKWWYRASHVLESIHHLKFENENKLYWLVEDVNHPSADLMMGMGGVIHFYLRMYLKGENSAFPMLDKSIDAEASNQNELTVFQENSYVT